jgi:Ornithine cyclodeaminase/mu-crystallin family
LCISCEQAGHNGDLAHAVEAGAITEDDVTELGDVLAGTAPGRQSAHDITIFDSTGLAIQDLAIALAAMERTDAWICRRSTSSPNARRPRRACPRRGAASEQDERWASGSSSRLPACMIAVVRA